tara:strand:+ start:192 stop:446 length:255 start_codon:yes stop_codon:yes gene_type:complete
MSRIPKIEESKYNNDSKFSWVDSQWEKFMSEQKELKAQIYEKEKLVEQLRKDLETCTKHYSKLWDEHKNLKKYLYLESKGDDDE